MILRSEKGRSDNEWMVSDFVYQRYQIVTLYFLLTTINNGFGSVHRATDYNIAANFMVGTYAVSKIFLIAILLKYNMRAGSNEKER